MDNITINCDFYHETHEQSAKLAHKFGVKATLKNPKGPGGGNPEYTLEGTSENLRSYLSELLFDTDTINYLLGG